MSTVSERSLDDWIAFAGRLADASRALFAPNIGLAPRIEVKPDRSLVTDLDRRIEVRLRELIGERYPAHGILGEEEGPDRPDAEFLWVLDPIDGTAPFIAGVPVYGTLIALLKDGRPIVGIIDLPVTQDRWVGAQGRPSQHGGKPCSTRACPSLGDAMLTTSNPDFFSPQERHAFETLRTRTRWRIYGGCCMSYGLLASGRTDLAIDSGLKLYDYAPFVPIIEGAGGVITDWEGKPLGLDSGPRVLAAGDLQRHREALALVQRALPADV